MESAHLLEDADGLVELFHVLHAKRRLGDAVIRIVIHIIFFVHHHNRCIVTGAVAAHKLDVTLNSADADARAAIVEHRLVAFAHQVVQGPLPRSIAQTGIYGFVS